MGKMKVFLQMFLLAAILAAILCGLVWVATVGLTATFGLADISLKLAKFLTASF